MKYWIAVFFLLTMVCFRGICAGDDFGGSANLAYCSSETKTGEEEESSWGFTQTYNLQATKEFTSKINLAANLGINLNETNDTKTTLLTPDIRLNLRNEYFDADTGYRITEKGLDILTMVSDEDRLTTESWNANFSTKSEKYPKVRLRYNEDMNYDYLSVRETDTKTTNFSGSADYAFRFLNFNYDYKNDISDNYVTECTTETDTHDGRINFRKSFWKNKIATSGSYSITNRKTETKTGGQDVEVAEKKSPSAGLYADDPPDPLNVTLTSHDSLIDGDKTTSTGIEIGLSADIDQNMGLNLIFATEVSKIYVYTTTPDINFNDGFYTWAVYASSDNITWRPIYATFDYVADQKRFEISFTKTTARYFKVVNTANDDRALEATEIEAYSLTIQAAYTTDTQESTTQSAQANLRYKPTDWLSFMYDFTQNQQKETTQDQQEAEPDQEKTRRQTHNATGRVERQLHKYLTASAQYQKRFEYDSEADVENKTTDTYLMQFLSSPLTTLDTDLSLNHTVSKEGGETQSKSSSALLHIAAMLREGADLDVDANITRSENAVSQSETTTNSINSNLRLELTRMLTAEIEYGMNWTETQQSESGSDTTGQTSNARTTFNWRPSHDFYFRGSYGIARDEQSGEETIQQQYNMSWLMTEKMQLGMGYNLDKNGTVSSTYSSDLSWNLSRMFTLRFNYGWIRKKADTTTETQTVSANLSASF